eukprot:11990810-Alexandrium_andersonii.AAC.1
MPPAGDDPWTQFRPGAPRSEFAAPAAGPSLATSAAGSAPFGGPSAAAGATEPLPPTPARA